MKFSVCIFAFVLLAACTGGENPGVETLRVTADDFIISLIAEGELQAAHSTAIHPPQGSPDPRTISWLAPNYSAVKKGDLIARFDFSDAERGALESGIELNKLDIRVLTVERELERLLSELGNELELVDIEKIMAEQFSLEDTLAYSRHELIDAQRDVELLEYRSGHFEGKKQDYSKREEAEIDVLDALRSTEESESQQHRLQIDYAELRAPHDGFFVYEKNWWGQVIDVGSTIFPSNKLASIPNLEEMEAVLHVLETEAVGLTAGQAVDLTIDAFPDRPLTGVLKSISATAAPIEQDNPVNYFTVIVTLDASDPEWITPDAPVTAEIHITRINETISVPNQALFQGESGDWVLVKNGRGLEKRNVTLGVRGANRSQVLAGLDNGDEIALYPPEESTL